MKLNDLQGEARNKILVVDDNPDALRAKARILNMAGYEVLEAETGRACLDLLQTIRPDLVLLDIILPDIDGLEVCRQIKANPILERLLVLLVSSMQTSSDQQCTGLESGADGYIAVPISSRELVARVHAMVRIKRTEDTLAKTCSEFEQCVAARTAELVKANTQLLSEIAERNRVEDALRRNEARHAKMMANIGDVVVIIDPNGINRYKSPNITKHFGWHPEEVVGVSALENVHPEDLASARSFIGAILGEPGATGTIECRYRCRDGSYKWIEFTAVNLACDPDIGGILGNYHDITERRQDDEKLRALSQVVEQTPSSVIITDLEGNIQYVNSGFVAMTGYTAAEALGKNPRILKSGTTPAETYAEMWRTIKDGRVWRGQLQNRRKDGALFWDSAVISPIEDLLGKTTRYVGIMDDITRRKQMEMSLLESENRYRSLVEESPDLIGIYQDGKLAFINAAGIRMFGAKTKSELLGRNAGDFVHPEDRPSAFERIRRRLAGETGLYPAEVRYLRLDGTTIPVEVTVTPITLVQTSAAQFIARDITERKRVEEALLEANRRLEKVAAAKIEFLAAMSHEIRTPMNGVLGMVELLLQTDLDSRQREFAQDIAQSGGALLRVIDDVLDFSKIEAGKFDIVREEFDVNSVVDGVVETVSHREPEKKLALAAIVDRNIPLKLHGDPVRLRQILLNLAGNAVKFTDKGEVLVRVRPAGGSGDSLRLRFEVIDSGIGLTQEQIGKLFQPFVQADSSTSRRYGGTGLGLAISRRQVELMGGEIGAKSAPRQGSTFWLEIPLGVPAQQSLKLSHPGLALAHAIVGVAHGALGESLLEHLSVWGVTYELARSADEFGRMLQAKKGHGRMALVLCDEAVLAQGGAALRQQLLLLKDRAHCVLLANRTTVASLEKETSELFRTVLSKPVKTSHLFDVLMTMVHAGESLSAAMNTESIASADRGPADERLAALRVLLAEDHKINRKLCLAMLKELGVIADTAANGFEVLAAMEKKTYDLILMDCHMPEMDGYQATAAIRQLETYSQGHRVRIVALTANALNGERERCLEAGMDDYLTKPFRLGQLRHFLSMALPASQADLEVLNPARLNQLCHELDARFVPEIVSDFARDLPENVAELKQCIESGNWAETERIAHSLKGVGASFGLDLLAAKFQVVERAAADKDAGTAVRLQDEFEPLAKLSADALRRWLQTAGSSM